MRDPLAGVKKAAKTRRRADEQYRAALVDAVAVLEQAGARDAYAQVAAAAGTKRQSVRELVLRARDRL